MQTYDELMNENEVSVLKAEMRETEVKTLYKVTALNETFYRVIHFKDNMLLMIQEHASYEIAVSAYNSIL